MEDGAKASTASPELLAVGQRLKAARELRRVTLEAVEEATHIRKAYLEAIEQGRAADLPAEVFLRGFLRTYANHLGLDGPALVEEYKRAVLRSQAETEGVQAPRARADRRRAPVGPRRGRARTRRGTARAGAAWWAVPLAALVLAGWAIERWRGPGQRVTPAATAPSSTASPSASAPAGPVSGSAASSAAAPTVPVPKVEVSFVQSDIGWQGTYLVSGATPLTVTIAADAPCWTRRWADGASSFSDYTLASSGPETVTWTASSSLKIQLGNAPAIAWIRVDGQPTRALPPQDRNPEWLTFRLASSAEPRE